jgi:crotonobetainyl-CoA:carnitine CoA-transferase CaiB-like acyl-CoA transferase
MSLLHDVQVLSLAVNLPGPAAAARLRDLGATVTKVEPPVGDMMATGCPAWYAEMTRGMRMLTLDLKTPDGMAQLEPLLGAADVLITATRPKAMARLGLGWPELGERYPRLCHIAVVGFPPPDEDHAGHDLTYQAVNGLVNPPDMPRTLIADLAGAERATSEALALLYARERTGCGGQRLVALSEAAEAMAAAMRHGVTRPDMFLGGALPNYAIYPAKEGHLAVAALESHFFDALKAALGLTGEVDHARLEAVLAERTAVDWEAWALERGLPLCACR